MVSSVMLSLINLFISKSSPKNNRCAGSVCHRSDLGIRHDTEKKLEANTEGRTDDKARPIDVARWRGLGDWAIFSFIEMVMVGTWEDVCVRVSGCVPMASRMRSSIWMSGKEFLITEAGIITRGRINSQLSVITHHGNSTVAAFSWSVPEGNMMKHIYPAAQFLCLSLTPSLRLTLFYLSSCLTLPLSLPNPDFLCCLPPTCFLATELTCPLFSALWICRCNPRFSDGIAYKSLFPAGTLSYGRCIQTNDPFHKHVVNLVFWHIASLEWSKQQLGSRKKHNRWQLYSCLRGSIKLSDLV